MTTKQHTPLEAELLAALIALKTANGGDNFTGWHNSFANAIKLANKAIEKAGA